VEVRPPPEAYYFYVPEEEEEEVEEQLTSHVWESEHPIEYIHSFFF
jgi:hypothetical protein